MKIGIDVRVFAGGKRTGVEEYTRNFLETLFARKTEHEFILFYNSYKGTQIDFAWATSYPHVTLKEFHFPNKVLNLLFWYFGMPKIDKLLGGIDVFFMPNNNFVALSRKVKLILTVHDLSFKHYKQTFSFKRRLWHWFVNPRKLVKRAHKIIAISQATKNDLLFTFKTEDKKVLVAPNGKTGVRGKLSRNDLSLISVKEKYSLPYKFILSFGTIEPRKNIVHTIRAFESFKKNYFNISESYKLVIAGSSGWQSDAIEKKINSSKYKDDIIRITDIPEEDKEALFLLADVFVYPSLYEGFGFPPLEAMQTKTPVITSHSSSLPEVVARHAILIDPNRPQEITQALVQLIPQKKLRDLLFKNSNIYINTNFSWDRVVDTFLSAIKK